MNDHFILKNWEWTPDHKKIIVYAENGRKYIGAYRSLKIGELYGVEIPDGKPSPEPIEIISWRK